MRTITRLELAKDIAEKKDLPVSTVRAVFDEFIEQMYDHYHRSEKVEVRGLGSFWPQIRKGRRVSIPGGRSVDVVDKMVMRFRPSKMLVENKSDFDQQGK